jgi:O-antigen/teichoic acid export membrane protein
VSAGDSAGFSSSGDLAEVLDSPTAGGKIIRGGALRTGGYIAGVALGIVSASLMIRHLGVDNYGKYVVIISMTTIVTGLTDVGMANVAARELAARTREERDRLLGNLLGIRLSIAVIGTLVAMGFSVVVGYEPVVILGVGVAGVGLLLTTYQQTLAIPIGVRLRFGWLSFLDFLRQAATVAAVVLLVLAGAGLLPFIAAAIPVGIVVLAAAIPPVLGQAPLRPAFELREWRWIAGLVGVYVAAAAVGSIYVSAAVIANSLVGSSEEIGYLGAAYRIYVVLANIPLLLIATTFPVIARAAHVDRSRLEYALKRIFDVALIVGAWMALVTIAGAAFAVRVVAGGAFGPTVPVLRVLGAVLLVNFLSIAAGLTLVSLRRNVELLVANGVALVATIVLTLVLVPHVGAKGAAIGMLVADTGLVVAYGFALARHGVLNLDLGVVPRVVLATALGAATALITAPLPDVLSLVLVTLVYWVALVLVRGLPREVSDALFRRSS